MKSASLFRQPGDGVQVCGKIISEGFESDSVEKQSTLIKAGTYRCTYNVSPRLSLIAMTNWKKKNPTLTTDQAPFNVKRYKTYEITKVEGRSGLRIHSDNLSSQLEGCIAPGYGYQDINKDGVRDIINSHDAVDKLEKHFNYEDFLLTIIDAPTTA